MGVLHRAAHNARPEAERRPLDVEEVYRDHVGYVFRLIQRFGVHANEIEDATQEVFVIVHRRLPEFDAARGSVRTWLFAIARRVAANRRRASQRRLRVVPPTPAKAADGRPNPEQSARQRQVLEQVGRFLETLPPEQREVFELIEIEGLRGPEASDVLEVKLNTVYTRLRLARLAFKAFAGRLDPDVMNGVSR